MRTVAKNNLAPLHDGIRHGGRAGMGRLHHLGSLVKISHIEKVSNQGQHTPKVYFVKHYSLLSGLPCLWQALQGAALSCKVKQEEFYLVKAKISIFT
jgi:hypothetical protein